MTLNLPKPKAWYCPKHDMTSETHSCDVVPAIPLDARPDWQRAVAERLLDWITKTRAMQRPLREQLAISDTLVEIVAEFEREAKDAKQATE